MSVAILDKPSVADTAMHMDDLARALVIHSEQTAYYLPRILPKR
jgi:hypothetical protein